MAPSSLAVFVQRFQGLQVQRDTTNQLIQDVILYCRDVEEKLSNENEHLSSRLQELKLDLDDAVNSRRSFQQKLVESERQIERMSMENDGLKNRNPYICVLIDGDGLIFQEHWIRQGLEGGKKAAYALRHAIASKCGEHAHEVEIVAKVIANITGLAKAMTRDGSLDTIQDLRDFTLGFSQAKATFDFVDIGYGKERTDSKIREVTRWHLRNHNCKQILLGISHDSGYAPFLDEMLRDEETRQCITVLEGYPTVKELVSTGVNVVNVGEKLFREDKLVDRTPTLSHAVSAPQMAPAQAPPALAPVLTPATSVASSTPPLSNASYANKVTSASPPPKIKIPLAPKPVNKPVAKTKPPQPSWNPGPRGLDEAVSATPAALEGVKKRKDNNKLCNNHYLRGECLRRDICPFVHSYKATPEEIKAIGLLSRLNPCTSGQECEAPGCIYGHHCPSVKDGVCGHPYCKFPVSAHPPGTKFKNLNIRDNV